MRTYLLALLASAALPAAITNSEAPTAVADRTPLAASFDMETGFDSLAQFVVTTEAFAPEQSCTYMAWQFAVLDLGQVGDPERGKAIRPKSITSCDVLWNNDDAALVFVTARPPTQTTNC